LLKRLFRQSCASLKADEIKDLASTLTILHNEKLKQEKDKAKGGKKKGRRHSIVKCLVIEVV
jgi:translation initiation factor 3 subunit J